MTVHTRRVLAGCGAVGTLLLGWWLASTSPNGAGSVVTLATAGALAAGLAAYVGASIAGEEQRHVVDDISSAALQRRQRRLGRQLGPSEVVTVIEAGAGSAREVAEVLDVYEYVARKMIDQLVQSGRAVVVGDRVAPAPAPAADPAGSRRPRASHWIDTDA